MVVVCFSMMIIGWGILYNGSIVRKRHHLSQALKELQWSPQVTPPLEQLCALTIIRGSDGISCSVIANYKYIASRAHHNGAHDSTVITDIKQRAGVLNIATNELSP